MKEGGFKEGECVLRGKIDMSSSFMCMRDPTLYRIRFQSHHQTDDQWCIYPMYDFAHCLGDAIEGVTHSLCTLEFQDNRRIYDWILDNLDEFNKQDRPQQYEFSRLNLEYTVMSKRKLQKLVENKLIQAGMTQECRLYLACAVVAILPLQSEILLNELEFRKSIVLLMLEFLKLVLEMTLMLLHLEQWQ